MTGNKMIDNVLIGLLVLASAGTLAIFLLTEHFYQRPLPSENQEKKQLLGDSKKLSFVDNFKLDKLIINLPSNTKRLRFLDVQAYLVPFKSDQIGFFEKNKSQIQDSIIDIASRMQPDEINTVSGKILLESRVKKTINSFYGKPVVKRIYFTKFVIQ